MRNLMSYAAKAFDRYHYIIENELELTCYIDGRKYDMVNDGDTITHQRQVWVEIAMIRFIIIAILYFLYVNINLTILDYFGIRDDSIVLCYYFNRVVYALNQFMMMI